MDSTRRLARWCLRLSKFDFDFVHYAGSSHQTVEALLLLNSAGQNKSPQKDDLPLCAIDSLDNPQVLIQTVAHGKNHARKKENTNPSSGETEYDSPHTVKEIRVQQQNTFYRPAATQVRQHRSEFIINSEGLQVRKTQIDVAVSIRQCFRK